MYSLNLHAGKFNAELEFANKFHLILKQMQDKKKFVKNANFSFPNKKKCRNDIRYLTNNQLMQKKEQEKTNQII